MTDKIYFFANFNLPALLSLAEQRRGGQTCTCDVSQMPKNGSLNWAIFLTFEDGVEWVFRSPKSEDHCFYSNETSSKILISEAATLAYLKAHTSIPVPEVGSSDNDIGVPYILQSKAPGRTLGSYDWKELPNEIPELKLRQPLMPISDANRAKVMSQLGSLMAELPIHRFEKIGSLFNDGNGGHTIGECLSPSFTWQDRDSLELERGPFSEEGRYYHSLISAFTTHAQELTLSPHVFFAPVPDRTDYKSLASYQEATRRWIDFMMIGQKIEHSKNILSYCIAGQFLSDMIPCLSSREGNNFILSHPDLHLGNIYVDEDLNITCIIDWSSAATGPISEVLAAPSLGTSAAPPAAYLTAAYRSGFGQRATEIKLDLPYSDLWQTSERMWYFTRLIRLLSKNDHRLFTSLFEHIYNTTSGGQERDGILWLFHERSKQDENVKLLATLQEDDLTAEELQEKERAWFTPSRIANSDVLAVARKLTLMAEMNPTFLADHRLWQWVEAARYQRFE